MGFYDNEGVVLPSENCVLPDPRGPQYADDLSVTTECTHCETKFLLVDRGEAAKWIDAEEWWSHCRTAEVRTAHYFKEPPLLRYQQFPPRNYSENDYDESGVIDYARYKNVRIEDNYFVDSWTSEGGRVDNTDETE